MRKHFPFPELLQQETAYEPFPHQCSHPFQLELLLIIVKRWFFILHENLFCDKHLERGACPLVFFLGSSAPLHPIIDPDDIFRMPGVEFYLIRSRYHVVRRSHNETFVPYQASIAQPANRPYPSHFQIPPLFLVSLLQGCPPLVSPLPLSRLAKAPSSREMAPDHHRRGAILRPSQIP